MGARNTKNSVKGERLIQIGSTIDGKVSRGVNETMDDKGQRLYKTEICRNFDELHSCRYGPKCRYAHGKDELRSVERHPRYKTIFCRTYQATGGCPYGIRCTFLHEASTDRTLPPSSPLSSPEQTPINDNTLSPFFDVTLPSSPNSNCTDDSVKVTPSVLTLNDPSIITLAKSTRTADLPSPPFLTPAIPPPGLDIPLVSPLPKALLSVPTTCPILCSSFKMNQQLPDLPLALDKKTLSMDHPILTEPSFILDDQPLLQLSYLDDYRIQLQKQQLVKAAFYSQKNQTPTIVKRRLLSGPYFTRNKLNDQGGFHCAVTVWPFTEHSIDT